MPPSKIACVAVLVLLAVASANAGADFEEYLRGATSATFEETGMMSLTQAAVDKVNDDPSSTWTATLYPEFASLPLAELRKRSGWASLPAGRGAIETRVPIGGVVGGDLPEEFTADYQIAPIKQGQCGSCWAVSSTQAMSDRFWIHTKQKLHLSAQALLACDDGGMGCFGSSTGNPMEGWQYVARNGLPLEACDPYTAGAAGDKGTCPYDCKQYGDGSPFSLYKMKLPYQVPMDEQSIKTELFENGPFEVDFIHFQDFLGYKGGVYKPDPSSGKVGYHAVSIVGWGNDPRGGKYWLVRNSYGQDWGEKGFFKAAISSNMWVSAVAGLPSLH